MKHIFLPNQNKLLCYVSGVLAGGVIAFILVNILLSSGKNSLSESTFLDVQAFATSSICRSRAARPEPQIHYAQCPVQDETPLNVSLISSSIQPEDGYRCALK